MRVKLSIVVAAYKAESYIDRFFDSIVPQLMSASGCVELIIVDDASPDNQIAKIRAWESKIPRMKIVRHQVNNGPGAARNSGIDIAQGDYLMFVDADDTLVNHAIRRILLIISEHAPDIIKFQYRRILAGGIVERETKSIAYGFFDLKDDNSLTLCSKEFAYGMMSSNGVYKRSISADAREDTSLRIGEDRRFGWEFFSRAQSAMIIPDVLYNYYQNSGSLSHTPSGEALNGLLRSFKKTWVEMSAHPRFEAFEEVVFRQYFSEFMGWYYGWLSVSKDWGYAKENKALYFEDMNILMGALSARRILPRTYKIFKWALSFENVYIFAIIRILFYCTKVRFCRMSSRLRRLEK